MSGQQRLLAMLNQPAAPLSNASSTSPSQYPQQPPSGPGSSLNPPSGGIREPSPLPPPPSLQSVSLDHLFRNLGSPPPPQQAQGVSNEMTPAMMQGQGGDQHHNKLLGMLGRAPEPQNVSGNGGPSPANGAQSPMGSNQAINLLSLFKSPPPPESATQAPQPPQLSVPTMNRNVDPSPPPHAAGSNSPKVSQMPEASASPAPKNVGFSKSPFDFVSPFDVFEKPSPKPQAAPAPAPITARASPAPKAVPSPKPQVASQSENNNAFAVPPARINGTVIHPGDTEASTASPTTEVNPKHFEAAPPSTQSGASKGTSPTHLPWLATKGSMGIQSKGPLNSHAKIDYSKLYGSASVNLDGLVSTVPVTKLKEGKTTYIPGRIVAMAGSWVAYGMSRGRIRLIDVATAGRTLLQLPESVTDTTFLDIAATATMIAVLAGDFSITVFEVQSSWQGDDPRTSMLVHIPLVGGSGKRGNGGLQGPVSRIEIFEQSEGHATLAVGGSNGVAFVDCPGASSLDQVPEKDILAVEEDDLLAFAINHTKSAVALLTESQISLFNTATRSCVWSKPIASDYPSLLPSSIQFCDIHVIVGRNRDTIYELVQLGAAYAILSTIELVAPEPSPVEQHYSHALYDPTHGIFWVAAHARGSLLGFRYRLKNASIAKEMAMKGSVVAFDKVMEIPIDPIVSFIMKPRSDGLVVFYASSDGYSKVSINEKVFDDFAPIRSKVSTPVQTPSVASQQTPAKVVNGNAEKKETKATPKTKATTKATPTAPAPAPVVPAAPVAPASEVEEKPDIREAAASTETNHAEPSKAPAAEGPDISALLKQTEDSLANRIKQNIESQLSAAPKSEQINGAAVAADVSAKIGSQIKAAVSEALQQELQKSLVPAATSSIQDEIRSIAPKAIQSALTQSTSTISKDIEKSLTANMPRIISNTVQPALERMLQDNLRQVVLPALASTSERLADQISNDFKSEMVQIRKDFQPPAPAIDHSRVLQTLVDSIAGLQKKVEQLSSAKAAPPAPPVQAPAAVVNPLGFDLEDVFTQALSVPGSGAIFQLVNDFWGIGAYLLPMTPDRKPPVSQAVIVTLLHRLAASAVDLPPNDPNLVRLISWDRRAAMHLNVNDPVIKTHVPRIMPSVIGTLETTIQNLMSRYGGEVAAQHVGQARAIIEILQAKTSGVQM